MSATAEKEAKTTEVALKTEKGDLITPQWHQHATPIQKFGTVIKSLPLGLDEEVRLEVTKRLNLLLADTASLRDLYKKAHWQVAGPTFYQLHLLFDKHFEQQVELVDLMAERVQILGGVSVATAHDVAELTRLERAPRDREEVPVVISRLLEAHEFILKEARAFAKKAADLGDDGTNDLLVSNIVRTNEMQVWFVSEHLVDMPFLIQARK
jgi:starvation-inducible DNA-binding protein